MADFNVAYNWMLDNEDAARHYATVPDAPEGSHAISGINSAAFPEEFARIDAIPQDQRGPFIENFYKGRFWNRSFDALTSDELAKRVFDAAVNMGPGTAAILLQRTIGITADGVLGPATVAAANAGDYVKAFIAARCAHYHAIVAAHPEDAKYMTQWLARASK